MGCSHGPEERSTLIINVSGLNAQEERGHYRTAGSELELATHVEPPHSFGGIEEA